MAVESSSIMPITKPSIHRISKIKSSRDGPNAVPVNIMTINSGSSAIPRLISEEHSLEIG